MFNGVVNVLTEKAAKVFRFEEQNQLHEEIIDSGLAQIYQSHLDVAHKIAADRDVDLERTLLDGKAFQKVLDHVRKTNPWLLVIGRIGVHSPLDEPALGSNAENLLRTSPCDVLLTTRLEYPELDVKAAESIRWTPEAEQRMTRVPAMVQGIARTAIYRLAVEKGHSVVSSDVLDEAMERFMPTYTSQQTAQLAEAIALNHARSNRISICKSCGVAASEPDPLQCSVCKSKTFEVVTDEMLEKIAAVEGGLQEETTYDGRKLKWSQDAKRALWTLQDAYKRRRAKARVEKSARIKKLSTITLDFAREVVEQESGTTLVLPQPENGDAPLPLDEDDRGQLKLIARDEKRNPAGFRSALERRRGDAVVRRPVGLHAHADAGPGRAPGDGTQGRLHRVATGRGGTGGRTRRHGEVHRRAERGKCQAQARRRQRRQGVQDRSGRQVSLAQCGDGHRAQPRRGRGSSRRIVPQRSRPDVGAQRQT